MKPRQNIAPFAMFVASLLLGFADRAAAEQSTTAARQPSIATGHRIALVIGNSKYAAMASLTSPHNDAELMARTLTSVGFQVTKIIDANARTMKQAALDFGRALGTGAEAGLFYYAGHGVQINGVNYLVPVDAVIKDQGQLDLQGLDVNAFLRVMEAAASKVNIVIVDASRNDPFATSFRPASRGLAAIAAPRGFYIAYSTSPGDVVEYGAAGNSPYTLALAAAMRLPGIRLEETFRQTRRALLEQTHSRQVPWETSSLSADFYFLPR